MRRLAGSVAAARGGPAIRTSPRSGVSSPAAIETVVVLPAPFGPSRPTIWPARTENDTSVTATSDPNDFRRFLISSISVDQILSPRPGSSSIFATSGLFSATKGCHGLIQDPILDPILDLILDLSRGRRRRRQRRRRRAWRRSPADRRRSCAADR